MMEKVKQVSKLFALKQIVEGTSDCTGEKFFKSLVKNLSEVLGTSGVWITEYLKEENKLNSLAFWLNGAYVDKYIYSVKNTPCESVLEINDFCHFPDKLIDLFPEDPDLPGLNAVSYLGLALRDTNGKVLGHLAALDSKPMKEVPEYFAIFRIFASRAAAELRRLKREQLLEQSRARMDRILNGISEAIIEVDSSFRITQVNQSAIKEFGYTEEKYRGMQCSSLFDPTSFRKILATAQNLSIGKRIHNTSWVQGKVNCTSAKNDFFPAEVTISAYEYKEKQYFALFIRNIQEKLRTEEKLKTLNVETNLLRDRLNEKSFGKIIGSSQGILNVLDLISKVAPTQSTVLIQGETGTGKELIAEAIYKNSKRKEHPFVGLNCAALPAELIESELFGHVKGAFTGATSAREGRFSMANGGTIFLDEIGEMPMELQSKLLRVIQEGEFEPVGSSQTKKVDVRIIAATHRNLGEEVKQGNFREDLFYRLNVFPIPVPPLRERENDVVLLAEAFLEKLAKREAREFTALRVTDRQALLKYHWPGNVRELQNIVERAIIISNEDSIDLRSLIPDTSPALNSIEEKEIVLTEDEISELQKKNLLLALSKTGWKISGKDGAAKLLNIAPTTLSSRIAKLGLKKGESKIR